MNVNYREQVGSIVLDDGKFFMDLATFKKSFLYFLIQYYRDHYHVSYYERLNDEGTL